MPAPTCTDLHVDVDAAIADLGTALAALGADPDAPTLPQLRIAIGDTADTIAAAHPFVVDPDAAVRFCGCCDLVALAAVDADLTAALWKPLDFFSHAQALAAAIVAAAVRDALTAVVAADGYDLT